MIDDLGQAEDARFQRLLAILVEKELGISQTRADDALVAADHRRCILRADVADDEELVGQLAGRVEQWKVFLVCLHGQNQAFLRHGEEFCLELANQDVRALDQGGHFIEQRVIIDRRQVGTGLGGSCGDLEGNLGAALSEAGDHRAITFQRLGVAVGIGKDDRIDGGFEAVTSRFAARAQAKD